VGDGAVDESVVLIVGGFSTKLVQLGSHRGLAGGGSGSGNEVGFAHGSSDSAKKIMGAVGYSTI
jgi:hypothetical protein